MTPEAQRIAIAKHLGFKIGTKRFKRTNGWHVGKRWEHPDYPIFGGGLYGWGYNAEACVLALPYYLEDLNAIHEAEKTLRPDGQRHWFLRYLHDICANEVGSQFCEEWDRQQATAAQRAKAFLRATGRWME